LVIALFLIYLDIKIFDAAVGETIHYASHDFPLRRIPAWRGYDGTL
jgi:hypothetical protein